MIGVRVPQACHPERNDSERSEEEWNRGTLRLSVALGVSLAVAAASCALPQHRAPPAGRKFTSNASQPKSRTSLDEQSKVTTVLDKPFS